MPDTQDHCILNIAFLQRSDQLPVFRIDKLYMFRMEKTNDNRGYGQKSAQFQYPFPAAQDLCHLIYSCPQQYGNDREKKRVVTDYDKTCQASKNQIDSAYNK